MSDTLATPIEGVSDSSDSKSKRDRSNLTKTLPTDRIAFDRQVAILRAFAAVHEANGNQPVTTDQAGAVLVPKFSGSTVTQAVGFFHDVGLLTRTEKGTFVPNPELVEYNKACQWDETEAKLKLRPVFEGTWFYRCLVPRLQLSPQSKAACIALLASESKASSEHQGRLESLLSYLQLASVISIVGDIVALLSSRPTTTNIVINTKGQARDESTTEERHTLFLDKGKERKVIIHAPLTISRAEYERVCKWIEVVLIVEGGPQNII